MTVEGDGRQVGLEGSNITILKEFPASHSEVFFTDRGTPYLKEPGIVTIAAPSVNISGLEGFLAGFPEDYKFGDYLADPTPLPPVEQLSKVAGQVCYASFGPKRTDNANAVRYLHNIIESGHGSVLEHASVSFFIYGISRACSHEAVRHRAGAAYSQLSQRYVSGRVLRFVERREYQNDEELHGNFINRIDEAARQYEAVTDALLSRQGEGYEALTAEGKTDQRKKVQQTARSLLPNETETTMVMTGNIRAWRHIISMRANEHAETEIRGLAMLIFKALREISPMLFADYEVIDLPDGTQAVRTDYPKV